MTLPTVEKESTLPVSEIFGPTIQGEGPMIGAPCLFLRVRRCPVHCPGCDTAYTWNGEEGHGVDMTEPQIQDVLRQLSEGTNRKIGLVVSGGEPLLYYKNPVLYNVMLVSRWTGLETSGFIGTKPIEEKALYNFLLNVTYLAISPKITPCLHGRQTDEELLTNVDTILRVYHEVTERIHLDTPVTLKFVVRDVADVESAMRCYTNLQYTRDCKVYLMPYGNERDEILKTTEWLVPIAAKYGCFITPRLQALLWGKKRLV